ncbi:hypothetical protein EAF04_001028 [Stromatinia cepivora]|nr:hypothetical protein EAF04_001028 [Stromatinia cepivora]
MPEAEQTNNGDYEFIRGEHTFHGVSYPRYMSWTAGSGQGVITGRRTVTRTMKTDSTELEINLDEWDNVTVKGTIFRLVKVS